MFLFLQFVSVSWDKFLKVWSAGKVCNCTYLVLFTVCSYRLYLGLVMVC